MFAMHVITLEGVAGEEAAPSNNREVQELTALLSDDVSKPLKALLQENRLVDADGMPPHIHHNAVSRKMRTDTETATCAVIDAQLRQYCTVL